MINNPHHRRQTQHLRQKGSKFTEEFKQLLEEVSEHEAFYRKQIEQFQAMMAKSTLKGSSRNESDLHSLNSPRANQQINRELQLYSLQQKYQSLKEEFSQQQQYYTQLLQLIASKDQWMSEQERKMAKTLQSLQSPPTSPNRQPDFDSTDQQMRSIVRLREKCQELTEENISLKQQLSQDKKKGINNNIQKQSISDIQLNQQLQKSKLQINELIEQGMVYKELNNKLNQTCQQLSEQIEQDKGDRLSLFNDIENVYKEQIKLLQNELKLYKYDNGLQNIYQQIGAYIQDNNKNLNFDDNIRKSISSNPSTQTSLSLEQYNQIEFQIELLEAKRQTEIQEIQLEELRYQNTILNQQAEENIKEYTLNKDKIIPNLNNQVAQLNQEIIQLKEQIQSHNFDNEIRFSQTNFKTQQQYNIVENMLEYEYEIEDLKSQLKLFKQPSINNSEQGTMTAESNQTIETVGLKIQEAVDKFSNINHFQEEGSLRHVQQIQNLSNISEKIFKADSSRSDQVKKTPQERQKLLKNITRTAIFSSEILNSKKDFTTLGSLAKDLP